jgi:hypothetical protein
MSRRAREVRDSILALLSLGGFLAAVVGVGSLFAPPVAAAGHRAGSAAMHHQTVILDPSDPRAKAMQ